MTDEQEFPQNPQEEIDIPLHGPVNPASQAPPIAQPTPAAPIAGTQISPSTVVQPATTAGSPVTPTITPIQPAQPNAPQVIQSTAPPPPAMPPANPPADLQTRIDLQWCPSCQVAVSQPEVGNVCPACGTPLVPLPAEYGPET